MSAFDTITTTAAAVCAAASGGVYLAFSAMVLPALNSGPATEAVAVMQRVNVAAVRPPFMTVFFGGAAASLAAAVTAGGSEHQLMRVGGAMLALASVAVTVAVNVPRNNALARVATGPDADGAWFAFERTWSRANVLRAVLALSGSAALAGSLAR